MSSEPSAYKEFGLNAWANPGVKKPGPIPPIYSGANDKSVVRWGHRWQPAAKSAKSRAPDLCLNCDQPRFAVDGKKCRGQR